MSDQGDIILYLERGGRLTAPDNAPPRYRAELLRIMASFVDSEMAGAAGFADMINAAPGIRERIDAARIVLEKLDHADRVLRLMGEFGVDAARYQNVHPWAARVSRNEDLGLSRRGGDMRLNVFHYPFAGWTDSVVMNVLMGEATVLQLGDLAECSYQPLADAFACILPREHQHTELGRAGLAKLAIGGDAARAEISRSIDYWWPRVAATFGGRSSARAELLRRFGLRRRANEELLSLWRARMNNIIGDALQSFSGRPN
ncbi:MAG: phenylacetate-CoA oxygenase subunit PaaI [Parvularculaceae bacterium]|nr:phenylacetate-CoA oxygenase subunit PaaI [Parvularculaceae bacterium]